MGKQRLYSLNHWLCCLEGQIGLETGECVSGKQVNAASLTATLVRTPLFLLFATKIADDGLSTGWR